MTLAESTAKLRDALQRMLSATEDLHKISAEFQDIKLGQTPKELRDLLIDRHTLPEATALLGGMVDAATRWAKDASEG